MIDKTSGSIFPLKAGDYVFFMTDRSVMDQKMQFAIDVALNEPGIVEGKPLLETVQHFADLVSSIFEIIKPCFI